MFDLRSTLLSLSIVAVGVAASAQSHAANSSAPRKPVDWPQFRFDKLHTGYQPHETALTPTNIRSAGLLWQGSLGGELVFLSSPAVVDGVAYIGEVDGTLVAYPANGCGSDACDVPLWQSSNLAEIVDSPTVANGIVYIGSQTDFDDASGKLNAFAAAGCGNAICPPLWQGAAGTLTSYSSPTVWKNKVFMGSADGNVYVFNADGCGKSLCKPLWKGRMAQGTESTAVIFKHTLFIGNEDGNLYAFDARGCGKKTCDPLWTVKTFDFNETSSSPTVSNGVVYIASDHTLSAIDANGCGAPTCEPVWQAIDQNDYFGGSPAIANGRIYVGLESQVNVYDAKGCGKKTCNAIATLFGSGMQDAIESSPTVANGVVYAGRNSGELLAWDAGCKGTCDEIWKGFTDDPIVDSSPTVVNGKIYIGGSYHGFGGRLYVFGLQ